MPTTWFTLEMALPYFPSPRPLFCLLEISWAAYDALVESNLAFPGFSEAKVIFRIGQNWKNFTTKKSCLH